MPRKSPSLSFAGWLVVAVWGVCPASFTTRLAQLSRGPEESPSWCYYLHWIRWPQHSDAHGCGLRSQAPGHNSLWLRSEPLAVWAGTPSVSRQGWGLEEFKTVSANVLMSKKHKDITIRFIKSLNWSWVLGTSKDKDMTATMGKHSQPLLTIKRHGFQSSWYEHEALFNCSNGHIATRLPILNLAMHWQQASYFQVHVQQLNT